MTDRRRALAAALLLLATTGLAGCSGDDDPAPEPTPTPTPTPTPPPRATPVKAPSTSACYRLTYRQAVSPTNGAPAVSCGQAHTAQTFAVGELDNVVAGHLLAVDSERVQADVASRCPAGLGDYVGGSEEDRRLSMLRAVWFTPSLERSAQGASWYRCDVVALGGAEELLDVTGSLDGVLDTEEGRDRYAMCGTANPTSPQFERVPCSVDDAWRAFSVIDLDPGPFPGADAVADAGAECEDAAAQVADDALNYEWASEGPDKEQWAAGQTFVRCWSPDA